MMQWLLEKFGYEKRTGVQNPAQWLIDWVHGGTEASSGALVNEESALKYVPFWAAVRVISGTVASLPFHVYRRVPGGGRERNNNHRAYELLHDRPNPYKDALTFIETRQAHVLTYGNGYAEIQREGAGRVIALWPLLPDRTTRKLTEGGVPYYEVKDADYNTVQLPDENVLHVKGLGFDGYTGYDVVSYHKEAIGYGVAVKEYGSRFFGNGAAPGGVLEYPGKMTDKAFANLKASWSAAHQGLSNAHRMQILEQGLTWKQTGTDPEQAQAMEVQKFTVDDCSRIFNIPPHKIGSLEHATYSNIEEQNIDFVTQTMYYWFRKWEQEANYKLFSTAERKSLFCEILVDGLLRGDIKSRYEAYHLGRQAGFLSVNDIREKENMNPIGDPGDIYLEPLNMKEAGTETPVPEPVEPSGDDGDPRSVIREIMVQQCGKLVRARATEGDFSTEWAVKVLSDVCRIMAASIGAEIDERVLITNTVAQCDEDVNEIRLAESLIDAMGGNHADAD
jgi:HK97 family phage portal protein